MISVMFAYEGGYLTVVFPCTETELTTKLNDFDFGFDIHNMWVHAFVEPKEFAPMEQQAHDLDELNYLAKRMNSFTDAERRRFFAAVTQEKIYQIPDLINLTFNLNRYTVIQDLSSAHAIGFTYALNEAGCLPAEAITDPKYGAIGKQLLESGTGILTEYGALFIHLNVEPEQVYDGQVFPAYDYHGGSAAEAVVSYGGKEETLYLPDEQAAIRKAIRRLGAAEIDDCEVKITSLDVTDEQWRQTLQRVTDHESLFAANYLLQHLRDQEVDIKRLLAAAEYYNVSTAGNIAILAEHCNAFGLAENVHTTEEVGKYFVENGTDYPLHPEMKDYFDYEGFGEHLVEYLEGAFVSSGFLYNDGEDFLCDIENELMPEETGMEMGGM